MRLDFDGSGSIKSLYDVGDWDWSRRGVWLWSAAAPKRDVHLREERSAHDEQREKRVLPCGCKRLRFAPRREHISAAAHRTKLYKREGSSHCLWGFLPCTSALRSPLPHTLQNSEQSVHICNNCMSISTSRSICYHLINTCSRPDEVSKVASYSSLSNVKAAVSGSCAAVTRSTHCLKFDGRCDCEVWIAGFFQSIELRRVKEFGCALAGRGTKR